MHARQEMVLYFLSISTHSEHLATFWSCAQMNDYVITYDTKTFEIYNAFGT